MMIEATCGACGRGMPESQMREPVTFAGQPMPGEWECRDAAACIAAACERNVQTVRAAGATS